MNSLKNFFDFFKFAFNNTKLAYQQAEEVFILRKVSSYLESMDLTKIYINTLDDGNSQPVPENRTRVFVAKDRKGQNCLLLCVAGAPCISIKVCSNDPDRFWIELLVQELHLLPIHGSVATSLISAYQLVGIITQYAARGYGILLQPYPNNPKIVSAIYLSEVPKKTLLDEKSTKQIIGEMFLEMQEKFIPIFQERMKDQQARLEEFNCK